MEEYTKIGAMEENPLVWTGSSKRLTPKWDVFDKFLELLADSQWHSLSDVTVAVSISDITPIVRFFTELNFISYRNDRSEVRINPLGSMFLELPHD